MSSLESKMTANNLKGQVEIIGVVVEVRRRKI